MALIPLSKADPSHLHPDTFDGRGWEVRSEADDDKVGTVDDVLMDASGMPHLLDVDLGVFKKHVLVPLRQPGRGPRESPPRHRGCPDGGPGTAWLREKKPGAIVHDRGPDRDDV